MIGGARSGRLSPTRARPRCGVPSGRELRGDVRARVREPALDRRERGAAASGDVVEAQAADVAIEPHRAHRGRQREHARQPRQLGELVRGRPARRRAIERGLIDEHTYGRTFFTDGRTLDLEGLKRALVSSYQLIEGVEPILSALKARAVPLHAPAPQLHAHRQALAALPQEGVDFVEGEVEGRVVTGRRLHVLDAP